MYENEGEYALSEANARSIVDDVMDTIGNDVPERNRPSVNLQTLFDGSPTEARADTNTPGNDHTTTSSVQSARARYATWTASAVGNKRCPLPLPEIPPHDSQPTWKNVPAAPTMNVRWTDDGGLEMVWITKPMLMAEPVRFYELYYCRETDDTSPDVPTWRKCGEVTATIQPMTCTLRCPVDGHTYYFALRAVDVHGRRAPFTITRITRHD